MLFPTQKKELKTTNLVKSIRIEPSGFKSSCLEQYVIERRKKNPKKEGKLAEFLHII